MTRQRNRCALPGCSGTASGDHTHCSALCRFVEIEMDVVDKMTATIGEVPEIQIAVKSLADALAAYRAEFHRVKKAALDVGMTPAAWRALLRGPANTSVKPPSEANGERLKAPPA